MFRLKIWKRDRIAQFSPRWQLKQLEVLFPAKESSLGPDSAPFQKRLRRFLAECRDAERILGDFIRSPDKDVAVLPRSWLYYFIYYSIRGRSTTMAKAVKHI